VTYVVWDTETTIRSSFKRKANPFDRDNYVVMSGWKRKGGEVVGEYFGRAGCPGGPGLPDDWFIKLLAGTKILVGQNIKFDVLYAIVHNPANLAAWMAWVADGGNVWDCQLAEYLLNGMAPEDHMLSMDELAPRYGGNLKFDEVKALWAAGVSTEDIDPGLLRTYLCGTSADHGDIGNTEVIFLGQLDRARACGQVKSIMMNMGSLLCTIEMERNGMAVDKALGLVQAAELAKRIDVLSIELSDHLPKDLPFPFNWNSGTQKSAIIFGGTVTYEKRMPTLNEDGSQAHVQMTVKVPVVDADGFAVTYKSGKNQGEVKYKNVTMDDPDKPKSAMRPFEYTFPRVTEPSARWKGSKENVWSTSGDVIEALANRGIPFLDSLSKVASLTKDLGTYYITEDPKNPGEMKGMLTLVQASGIIHHMLNHTSTVTGRFSSSNPNLQNLPKEDKSTVKGLFVSRFPGGKIVQSDFKSLEVYVQAVLTKCKQLISDLKAGLDMHCVRVSQTYNITYEQAVELCTGVDKLIEWVRKRTDAKVFSFQRAYGAGAKTIAENTGIPLETVEALIAAECLRYPEIEPFFADLTSQILANSKPTGIHFNHPDIPGLSCNPRKGYYRTPDNKLYTWRENAAPEWMAKRPASKGGKATSFSPTEIKNYPVQGGGGEWAKAAMWLAIRAYYKMKNWGGRALLVNQVHDALYTDAMEEVALEAAACLHAAMEEASVFMEWYFDWPIPVPVPTDTEWGPNMMDHEHMPEAFKPRVAVWRASIRRAYIDNYSPSFEQPERLAA
jgi:DNA polymerase I-like protein with 3'-5' exonuclease and polymerase domains